MILPSVAGGHNTLDSQKHELWLSDTSTISPSCQPILGELRDKEATCWLLTDATMAMSAYRSFPKCSWAHAVVSLQTSAFLSLSLSLCCLRRWRSDSISILPRPPIPCRSPPDYWKLCRNSNCWIDTTLLAEPGLPSANCCCVFTVYMWELLHFTNHPTMSPSHFCSELQSQTAVSHYHYRDRSQLFSRVHVEG